MNTALSTAKPTFDLSPQTFDQALTFANYLADSDMVPKDFKGKPGNCLIAMQWGMEIGLKPLQALQNIAVINGRPSLWGDAVIALVRNSPAFEYIVETQTEIMATCRIKRRGEPEHVTSFGLEDAKLAGLLGKPGPWTQYRKRMMQMRARAFAVRDVFPDVLKGLPVAEELMDTPAVRDMGAATVVQPTAGQELIDAARAAADKGREVFGRYWKEATPADRGLLRDEVNDLKRRTEAADKLRTVETHAAKPAETPAAAEADKPQDDAVVMTFAKVMDMLVKSKTAQALEMASDWIGEVADPEQRAELLAKHDALRAVMVAG